MELLTQSPGGWTRRSSTESSYEFWVAEIEEEGAGDEWERERTKSRTEENSTKEEMRSRRSEDKENERSQDSEDESEGRSAESLEGENASERRRGASLRWTTGIYSQPRSQRNVAEQARKLLEIYTTKGHYKSLSEAGKKNVAPLSLLRA
ncbi:hypothetical protein NDU88_004897 [Pleurodeles waltl]|uniref:Uncharacterized protein n=1 Tax=Pleurodeles waltl TaxID=8319 RepID=A0AAV7MYV4_PLEWA|nr:hypothetical protein NDU88_004897 [Pleurodeles waltl]